MLGVPMKPAGTAMFLLLGLSPLNTLTLLLVMCCIGPFGGAVPVLKSGNYHQKLVCAAVLGGSLGAVLGSLLALSLPQYAIITDSDKNPADVKTLDALQTLDITTLRTADGDVHLFTDGMTVSMP